MIVRCTKSELDIGNLSKSYPMKRIFSLMVSQYEKSSIDYGQVSLKLKYIRTSPSEDNKYIDNERFN